VHLLEQENRPASACFEIAAKVYTADHALVCELFGAPHERCAPRGRHLRQ
jgi:hypothetical protein